MGKLEKNDDRRYIKFFGSIMMNPYLIFILSVIIITYTLELVVELLNLKNLTPELPAEFRDIYDTDRYEKSQLYLKDNTKIVEEEKEKTIKVHTREVVFLDE